MVTRKEVAERAGVSVATVSNVLSKKVYVLPETVEKVERAVRELKYVPNFTARSLSLGHAYQIGIAVSECTNPYHMEVFEAISDYSLKRGFMVTLFSMNSRFNNAMNFLTERQFDAFINFSNQEFAEDVVELLIRKKTILVNFPQTGLSFSFDYYDAMQEVMEKVCELGHAKVGYVSTMDSLRFAVDRRGMAFYDHRARLGFGEDDDYIVFNDDYSSPSEAVGYRKTKELFARKNDITAIFVTNDLAAIGAERYGLARARRRVGDRVRRTVARRILRPSAHHFVVRQNRTRQNNRLARDRQNTFRKHRIRPAANGERQGAL